MLASVIEQSHALLLQGSHRGFGDISDKELYQDFPINIGMYSVSQKGYYKLFLLERNWNKGKNCTLIAIKFLGETLKRIHNENQIHSGKEKTWIKLHNASVI